LRMQLFLDNVHGLAVNICKTGAQIDIALLITKSITPKVKR